MNSRLPGLHSDTLSQIVKGKKEKKPFNFYSTSNKLLYLFILAFFFLQKLQLLNKKCISKLSLGIWSHNGANDVNKNRKKKKNLVSYQQAIFSYWQHLFRKESLEDSEMRGSSKLWPCFLSLQQRSGRAEFNSRKILEEPVIA
jgi:hypothetical protein